VSEIAQFNASNFVATLREDVVLGEHRGHDVAFIEWV
jgi:hypothetical protein